MDPSLLLEGALKDGSESVDFLNDLVAHLWKFINPAVGGVLKSVVEPRFEQMLPRPFKATQFRKIELGAVPMRFNNADVIARDETSARLDLDLLWDGKCDIELESPIIGTYGIESIKLKGRVSVLFQPLVPTFPILGGLQISFVNPPFVDLDFTGLLDIGDVAFLRGAIRGVIANVINRIVVLPNRLTLGPFVPGNYDMTVPPLGYLRVNVESGDGFKTTGRLVKDVPDVYCKLSLGAEDSVRTPAVPNTVEPIWVGQSFDFLLSDPQQMIEVLCFDEDLTGDDYLGGASFPAYHLLDAPSRRQRIPLRNDDGPTGAHIVLIAELRPFTEEPSNSPTSREIPNLAAQDEVEDTESKTGLLDIFVSCAKDIQSAPDLEPFVKVIVGDDVEFATSAVVAAPPLVDPCFPVFNQVFHVPLRPFLIDQAPSVKFELCNAADVLGSFTVSWEDIVGAPGKRIREMAMLECGASLGFTIMMLSCS